MNQTVNQRILKVAGNITQIQLGTTIRHAVLAEMLEVAPQTQTYYQYALRLKRILRREHGIFFDTVNKVGYVLVLPGNEIDVCEGEYNHGIKRAVRATISTNCIKLDKITDQGKHTHTIDTMQKMANICGMLKLAAKQPGTPFLAA